MIEVCFKGTINDVNKAYCIKNNKNSMKDHETNEGLTFLMYKQIAFLEARVTQNGGRKMSRFETLIHSIMLHRYRAHNCLFGLRL